EELFARSKQGKGPAPVKAKAKAAKPKAAAKLAPGKLTGAVKATMPQKFKPMLATPADGPPHGDTGWIHEIKFDGYRTLAFVTHGKVRLITRTGIDWTERYGVLTEAFADLPCK